MVFVAIVVLCGSSFNAGFKHSAVLSNGKEKLDDYTARWTKALLLQVQSVSS